MRAHVLDLSLLNRALMPGSELTAPVLQSLEQYAWPGNIAELHGALLHAGAIAGDVAIDLAHLLPDLRWSPRADVSIQLPEEALNMEAVAISLLQHAPPSCSASRAIRCCIVSTRMGLIREHAGQCAGSRLFHLCGAASFHSGGSAP